MTARARYFYTKMPFLSPNQQCQSTEGIGFKPLTVTLIFTEYARFAGQTLVIGKQCIYVK